MTRTSRAGLCRRPGPVARGGHALLPRLHLGADLAAGARAARHRDDASTISTSRPRSALVQDEVRPNQRVLAGALLLLVMNFIGLGLGPTWVGPASDWFKAQGHAQYLQSALYTLTPFYLIAIALFLWLARILRRESRNPVEIPHETRLPRRVRGLSCSRRARRSRNRRRSRPPQGPCRAASRATSACSRASPMPSRRWGRCAGRRPSRSRPGRVCARRPSSARPASSRIRRRQHLYQPAREDERGLPDAQHLGAEGREEAAGVRLDPWRRAGQRL